MGKSRKKQCRKPKPTRRGGGLVVVSAGDLQRPSIPPTHGSKKPGPLKKGKKRRREDDLLDDPLASGNISSDDDLDDSRASSSPALEESRNQRFLFAANAYSAEHQLYYLLATVPMKPQAFGSGLIAEEGGCHSVVFVKTVETAQVLLAQLKVLDLSVYAVHERTPKAQRQGHIRGFLSATSSAGRSSVLILTNAFAARAPVIGQVTSERARLLRIVHFDAPEGKKMNAARQRITDALSEGRDVGSAQEIYLGSEGEADTMAFTFDREAMRGVCSRLAVAKKLAKAMMAGGAQERAMQRAASAAGLVWSEETWQGGSAVVATARKRIQAQVQQASALKEKLRVLLCRRLLPNVTTDGGAAVLNLQQSPKEIRKKLALLGMVRGQENSNHQGSPRERAVAHTRWLDGRSGSSCGGTWAGDVRTGANCDATSLEVRAQMDAAKGARKGCSTLDPDAGGKTPFAKALSRWSPNPNTPDPEFWGGRYGKPCGHNEVVLQYLRPFAPMEVLNTRVCSKAAPAPGNIGFDGCLELLSLTCKVYQRALTVWDDASFTFIDERGANSSLAKKALLHLPLPTLRFLVKNMRSFTVCSEGQKPPQQVARTVIYATAWAAKEATFGPLSARLSTYVMSFALSGDIATWKSVSESFGVKADHQTASAGKSKQPARLAFASKKKRKNFNL